jgi:predicted ABC-class ATPase
MSTSDKLSQLLNRINGKGYKAYKQTAGQYSFDGFDLFIDHVQGDPFAAPTKIRVRMPRVEAGLPDDLTAGKPRRFATEDFLGRSVRRAIRGGSKGRRGTGKSGLFEIDAGGQEILERTAVVIRDAYVEARIQVGLPADGRTILGREAEAMLCRELPDIVRKAMKWGNISQTEARVFVETAENYAAISGHLDDLGLIAFVADGSILPRESGASNRPLTTAEAIPFQSCQSFKVDVEVPNPDSGGKRQISGMGIPKGITLIVGGGYHGKSTLLRALERGVYPHVPGDGRQYVVTNQNTVKIRAEDGRRIECVDISPFISNLPYGRNTATFTSDDASGSTSQAANIVEAAEIGAEVLLLDEDTSATNFMVRDSRMQKLVDKDNEPITPFLDRVRELYDAYGISTVLVMGGCGDYFDAADHVILMRDYLPYDATGEASRIAREIPTDRRRETAAALTPPAARVPDPSSFDPSRGRREVKIDAVSSTEIIFGRHRVDLRSVEQLVDLSQTRAVGHAIHLALREFMTGNATLNEVVDKLDTFFDEKGLDPLDPYYRPDAHPGNFARPRKYEIAAAINRLRTLRMKQK